MASAIADWGEGVAFALAQATPYTQIRFNIGIFCL